MILKKIEILHFGKLNNITFDLNDNLDVFLGQNESGKSTTVAFIKQIMFGFHLKSNKSVFFEDYVPLDHVSPMGGKLTFGLENDTYVLERLYAKGDTKKGILTVYLNKSVVPDNVFFDQIKNIDGNFYADSFIFNQDMLREVALLNQNELMEQIYFLGASQSGKLIKLRDTFKSESEKLFKKTGRKPEINQLIKNIYEQKDKVDQSTQEFENYKNLEADFIANSNDLKIEQKKYQELEKKRTNLNSLEEKLTNYQKLVSLKKEIKPMEFSEDSFKKARNIKLEIQNLQDTISSLEKGIPNLEKKYDDMQLNDIQNIIDQKAELLQWLNEKKTLQQSIDQLITEINQFVDYQPDAIRFNKLTRDQQLNLKDDMNQMNDNIDHNSESFKFIGIFLVIIGLILLFINQKTIGIFSILIGVLAFIYKFIKDKNTTKQNIDFKSLYGFDPHNTSFETIQDQALKINSKKVELEKVQNNLKLVDTSLINYKKQLAKLTNQELDDNSYLLSVINNLQKELEFQNNQLNKSQELNIQISTYKSKLKDKEIEFQKNLNVNNVRNIDEFENKAQIFSKQEKIKLEIETLENNLKADLASLAELVDNQKNIDKKKVSFSKEAKELQVKISEMQEKKAVLQVKMQNLTNSDKLYQEKQILANYESDLEIKSSDYLANLLASQLISKGLDIASNERFPKMLKSAKEYFSILTGGRYLDIVLDKKITVKNQNNKKIAVEYLSRGTSEQLYFALKLAFIEQISDKISLPILIDDAFVNFDSQRTEFIKELIKQLSKRAQVLIFTQNDELARFMDLKVQKFTTKETK